ncbi:hypothetical protein [Nocardioides psychrotolerans]|nr:hypothetical protein [Nocardioides psychrotolerans]
MADIDALARRAALYRHSTLIDPEEAVAIAWLAIVEDLYTEESTPTRFDLIVAGTRALSGEIKRMISYHGINAGTTRDQANGSAAPKIQQYWSAHHNHAEGDFTERVAERLTLPVVLSVLTAKQYDVIATLAAFDGDTTAAAKALGMEKPAYLSTLRRGRHQILAVWHEHETPHSQVRVLDPSKCYNGHDRAEHSIQGPNGKWACLKCRSKNAVRHSRNHRERQKTAALWAETYSSPT